ncbi:MAG: hypothetical protein II045_08100, partial [Oscillospiraceae bacterium]|nr:hypothetical protein [Oscillospiraceae bacterium]
MYCEVSYKSVLASGASKRKVSPCGASSFARGGKGTKTPCKRAYTYCQKGDLFLAARHRFFLQEREK